MRSACGEYKLCRRDRVKSDAGLSIMGTFELACRLPSHRRCTRRVTCAVEPTMNSFERGRCRSMAWSTRELADMSGTTVSAIRHYHRLGLLPLPERRMNGYKEYGVEHLVSVLRIRRYADLGVPLVEIDKSSAEDEGAEEMLRALDEELAAGIERMTRARADIASILSGRTSMRVPSGFEQAAARLSDADRSMVHVFTRLFEGQQLDDLQTMVAEDIDVAGVEFDALPHDADEDTRAALAVRLAPSVENQLRAYQWLSNPVAHVSRRVRRPDAALQDALIELYSAAQLDVLGRAHAIANARLATAPADGPIKR